ncbi:MAG: hypothetical protein NWF09_01385 [Candidatus Bathyarchaeota archaeon]|nr:hypothetical protein [Candidatus Bathyarchaeota archaeon]
MSGERKIPKAAVKPLAEYCQKLSGETGQAAAEIFREFLELMRKYSGYFFQKPWPEKLDKEFEPGTEDLEFIDASKDYSEERERFIVMCLRRNMSLEGFDAVGFEDDFNRYGRVACLGCVVPEAARVKELIKQVEESVKKNEEEVRQANPSWVAEVMNEYYKRPEVVRRNKMLLVELRLYEEIGLSAGKSCEVRNKYKCPYGEGSKELIENGQIAKFIWNVVWWYDLHWNPVLGYVPPASDRKWHHYGEPSIIDVTDYDDILKAIEDGRLNRIIEEQRMRNEEHKVN